MKRYILIVLLSIASSVFAQSDVVGEAPNDTTIVRRDLAKNAEYFSKGLEAKYNENYPIAIYNFEQALRFFNDDDASMYELSALYLTSGRNAEALSMIQQAANLQPDNKWYQIRLAQLQLQNGDYQSFMAIYDKLLQDEPDNLDYLEAYIDALLRIGEYDKVIEKLDVVEHQLGKNEIIYLQKAQIYDEQGKKDKAMQEIEKLVEFMPENTRYRAMLAEAYRKAKRDKDAYQHYLKIKELDPDDKYVNVSLMDYYWSSGDTEKASEELIAVIKNKNLDYDTKFQITTLWFQRRAINITIEELKTVGNAFIEAHPDKYYGYFLIGEGYSNDKDYAKAKEYYKKSLEYNNSYYFSLFQLSLCDMQLNDNQELIEITNNAISFHPDKPHFYLFNGIGYYNLKDYENAIKVLEKGRKFSAYKDLTATFDTYIGDTYHQLNNKQKAYEAYDRVLLSDPENVYVLNNYSYFLSLDNHDLERALEMSAKTIKAEPKNVTYLDTYAWILYKLERYQEAKKYMDKVFKYDKNPQGVNYEHLGDILYKMGDTKNALKNWKKAKKAGGEVSEYLDQKIKDEKLYE